jgi:malonyl-CoA O-methyltransferase
VLLEEAGKRLLDRLDYMRITPRVVVDLGSGTGHSARVLERRYPGALVVVLDSALQMLQAARRRQRRWFPRTVGLCADATQLPLASASTDLVFSSLCLPWCREPRTVFRECRRILKPGGLLLFSTLGPATLHELRSALDSLGAAAGFPTFDDLHETGDDLVSAGLSSPVLDREDVVVNYPDMLRFIRDLRACGSGIARMTRAPGLGGRAMLTALGNVYPSNVATGMLPATFELLSGHAWCPAADTRPQDGSTVATFPLKNLGRRPP